MAKPLSDPCVPVHQNLTNFLGLILEKMKNDHISIKSSFFPKIVFFYFREFRESNLMPATRISNENNDWFAKGKYVSKYVLFRSAVKKT